MGLEKTQAIGRIVVHPTNPNIVYVAALGAPWNANPERGLYKTEDGGQTWQLVKFISDKAGVVDVALDPSNPNVVWAASWQRVRGPYFLNSGGPGSALWKSTDAGKTWTEVKGGGFPETMKGRIGIAISLSNPRVMYTMVEADTLPNREAGQDQAAREIADGSLSLGRWRRDVDANQRAATRGHSTTLKSASIRRIRIASTGRRRRCSSRTTAARRRSTRRTAFTSTTTRCGSIPYDPDRMIVGDDGGVGDLVRPGRHLHVRRTASRSGSSTT